MTDTSMLELYRMEAESHGNKLASILDSLPLPADEKSLVALRQEFQAIESAARIVDLPLLGELASSASEALSGLEEQSASPLQAVLQHIAALFVESSKQAADTLPTWTEERSQRIAELAKSLSSPMEAEIEEERADCVLPEGESTDDSAPIVCDMSLLELFRAECESNVRVLAEGLEQLGGTPNKNELGPLQHAAHSLLGASRIVGLDIPANLAIAIESALAEAVATKQLDPGMLKALLLAADAFAHLSAVETRDIPAWLQKNETRFADALADIEEGGIAGVKQLQAEEGPEPDFSGEHEDITADEPEQKTESSTQKKVPPAPAPKAVKVTQATPVALPNDLNIDLSLLDLFKIECEENAGSLSNGLVDLEESQTPDKVEPLMRAAHSLKGAARIIGLNPVMELAHDMEDLLVAAQNGTIQLNGDQIDSLLAGSDIFAELAEVTAESIHDWLAHAMPRIEQLRAVVRGEATLESVSVETASFTEQEAEEPTVQAASQDEPQPEVSSSATDQAPSEPKEPCDETAQPAPQTQQKPCAPVQDPSQTVVRVTAEHLSRLMGLAGESLVQSRRLMPFATRLNVLKDRQGKILHSLDRLREKILDLPESHPVHQVLEEVMERAGHFRDTMLTDLQRFDNITRRSENISARLYNEVVRSRMRPFEDGVHGYPRLIRDVSRELGKKVDLQINGRNTEVDREILEKLDAPLNHLVRNALDHGLEVPDERKKAGKPAKGTITISASHRAGMLWIVVSDDGRGIDPESIRTKIVKRELTSDKLAQRMSDSELMDFLFLPGFSTKDQVTKLSGRGVGLDVVHSMVQDVGGTVRAESRPGKGLTFTLTLPLTLSVVRTLVVDIAGEPYAFPLTRIDRVVHVPSEDIETVEDRQYYVLGDDRIGLVSAAQVLEVGKPQTELDMYPVIVISDRLNRYGLVIDSVHGEHDLVVRPIDPRLGNIPDVNSTAILEDGSPVLIVDVEDIVRSVDNLLSGGRLGKVGHQSISETTKRVLVVDDSLTVREVERKLLEARGYEVETAVDGMDGYNAVTTGHYDLVVTDVDMPRMNGIELVQRIKNNPDLRNMPVMIVSYKDRKEDRIRGMEAGADYYLTKSSFQDETLIEAVGDLIGEAHS